MSFQAASERTPGVAGVKGTGFKPLRGRGGFLGGGDSTGGQYFGQATSRTPLRVGGGPATQAGGGGAAGGGGGAGGGAGTGTGITRPTGSAPPPLTLNANEDPEFARARQRAEGYLGELETGAGYASEVMQGNMQSQIDSDVERAREAAAAQGMPFDEAAYRRDANSKMQGALAQEKLGREQMRGNMMAGLQGVISGGAENKLNKNAQEISRYGTEEGAKAEKYRTEAGIYGTEVGAATQNYATAMNALNQFLQSFSVNL